MQLPLRLHDALRGDDIDLDTFGLITYVAGECWRNDGEAVFTTAALRELIGYEKTSETLLTKLKAAKPEWIEFELSPRQRQAITFRLTGATVRQHDDTTGESSNRGTAESDPPSIRQSSSESRQSKPCASALPERDSEPGELPTVASPVPDREEKRREEERRAKPLRVGSEENAVVGEGTPGESEIEKPSIAEEVVVVEAAEEKTEPEKEIPGESEIEKAEKLLALLPSRRRYVPLPGDDDFAKFSRDRHRAGHLTEFEHLDLLRLHRLVRDTTGDPATEQAFLRDLLDAFPGTSVEGESGWGDAAELPPCRWSSHRGQDWRNRAGRLVCGVCHPPAGEVATPEDER